MTATKPIISDNVYVQTHYERCLREGTSHKLAEMFALGITPCIKTDATFLRGHANGSQFQGKQEFMGDYYKSIAESKGQSTKGKVYLASLAAFPGDPEAWVDGRGDVERVIRKRGWKVEGAVNVDAIEPEEVERVAVADDIVNEKVLDVLEEHPEPHQVDVQELREKIIEKHKAPWHKGGTAKKVKKQKKIQVRTT